MSLETPVSKIHRSWRIVSMFQNFCYIESMCNKLLPQPIINLVAPSLRQSHSHFSCLAYHSLAHSHKLKETKKNFNSVTSQRDAKYQRRIDNLHAQRPLFSSHLYIPLCFGSLPFPQYTHPPRFHTMLHIYRLRTIYSFSNSARIFSPLARAASMSPTI